MADSTDRACTVRQQVATKRLRQQRAKTARLSEFGWAARAVISARTAKPVVVLRHDSMHLQRSETLARLHAINAPTSDSRTVLHEHSKYRVAFRRSGD